MCKYCCSSANVSEMAFLVLLMVVSGVHASTEGGEMSLKNITRFAGGDFFTIAGTDCGPTRCMEASHGTALSMMGAPGCVCQCHTDTPAFREDQRLCVNNVDECQMASFGRGATKPQIPFVFLPMKGQIIYPAKEIVFTDVEDAICAVTSAQYLSPSGWMTLRDVVDNDVPFGLYRDEGKTFLQWRGSATLHSRLEGRLVATHVLCTAQSPPRMSASCAAFRVAGAAHNSLLDVRSIPFHAGETVTSEPTTQSQGLSVIECLAIGVCVLMLIFIYAAGIVFYIHYKQRQKRKEKDPEMNHTNTMSTDNSSTIDSRIEMDNMRMKTNPLLGLEGMNNDFLHDAGLSDVSEHTEDTIDSSPNNTQKFQKSNSNVISAIVHTRRKKNVRPSSRSSTPERMTERMQRRSASPDTLERAPHSDLSIVDCSLDAYSSGQQSSTESNGEPALRRKLYFNPVFFETEHLKNPPAAAIDFLVKIREVMSIAKEKMTSKRFIPLLSDIPEEELYHTIDLGWDIPCARRGRRFSAISLKRENSRRAVHCGGCPGCDSSSSKEQKVTALVRSNSCKSCVSDDYKQNIVRKWLDEVPTPPRTVKSVAKVSGTPRVIEPQKKEEPVSPPVEPRTNANILKIAETVVKLDALDVERAIELATKDDKLNIVQPTITAAVSHVSVNEKSPTHKGSHATRRVRKKLPPPPPPPITSSDPPTKVEEPVPIPPEIKKKMAAVIRELNQCRRVEPKILDEIKTENVTPITPKIIIPVLAADSQYYSDDNMLSDSRKRDILMGHQQNVELDSLDRNILKMRRFSVACGPEFTKKPVEVERKPSFQIDRSKLSRSWRDVRKAADGREMTNTSNEIRSVGESQAISMNEISIINSIIEPLYNNIANPGPLTIQVRGSPIENRRNNNEEFDPDTLDRKPRREAKKRVDKILLKSGGSFKYKSALNENFERNSPPESAFTRKIGSLRQIYEAKSKEQEEKLPYAMFERRGSSQNIYSNDEMVAFMSSLKTPDLIRQIELQKELKPPVPPKQRRCSDITPKLVSTTRDSPPGDRRRSPEERDKYTNYHRSDNLNARRSGRRSARTRSRRTDLRKLYRTEDSGYLSTDSNESKRRAHYLLQLKPRIIVPEPVQIPSPVIQQRPTLPPPPIESDTDDLESLCDGRSESGGESVETDSVFFGNFDESKQLFAELGLSAFEPHNKMEMQIDSGFAGETNIILSGDSDSEHRSVISIVAGVDGRASSASITKLDDQPYVHSVEC